MITNKKLITLLTSIIGSFLITYFTGYSLGLLKNLADIKERYEAGD